MRGKLFCSAIIFLSLVAPSRAEKRAFTLEDYFRFPRVGDMHLSPDGRTVVFTVGTPDLGKAKLPTHIWTMDADGTNTRQITYGDSSEGSPIFSPDSKSIAFVSSRDGADNIYVISLTGGEAR